VRVVQNDTWLRVSGLGVDRQQPRRGARWMSQHGMTTYTVNGPMARSLGHSRGSRPHGGEAEKVLSRL